MPFNDFKSFIKYIYNKPETLSEQLENKFEDKL